MSALLLGVRSWNEVVRIESGSLWVFRPGLTGRLEGQVSGEVISQHEGRYVHLERSKVGMLEGLDRGFFDRPVHAFD